MLILINRIMRLYIEFFVKRFFYKANIQVQDIVISELSIL